MDILHLSNNMRTIPMDNGNDLITIGNDGTEIIETTYWESSYAKAGKVFLSINAGAFRLLVPDGVFDLQEAETGKDIIISLGPGMGKHAMFEIMFDDTSDNPYCVFFGSEQSDRLPNDSDHKKIGPFIVYGKGLQVLLIGKCYFRKVNRIPCMKSLKAL